ncbi:MAG: hypothetical protein C5B49_05155 [Bdellovibrio sp.]|nr:MAG: hypothetical protein C5B49_05155 [Bdellovibrio sp.]
MELDQITFHLENSVTLKLLKSDYATIAVGFFFYAFKQGHKVQMPETELKTQLEIYLQQYPLQFSKGGSDEISYKNPLQLSERLISMWCDDRHRFLRRYYDYESETPLVELSYDTERALEWMESLEKREFVGTHSRFFMIFQNLRTLVENINPDPQVRLKILEKRKKELNQEMKEIQETGGFKRMDATQIRERFLNLLDDSRRLVSDFGLVEEIFKELTQKIKEKKLIEFVTKGQILGEILDAYDYLEESDQGKSFHAFWDFLMSSEMQTDLNEMIDQVLNAGEIKRYIQEMGHSSYGSQLKRLKANLLQVGRKVLQSKMRLSEELRKLLHQKALLENKQVMNEISEIKKMLLEHKKDFFLNEGGSFVEIEFLPDVQLPMERPLWKHSQEATFSHQAIEVGESGDLLMEQQLRDLKKSFYLDKNLMRQNILSLFAKKDEITLQQLVQTFPVEKGLSEIIAYQELLQEEAISRVVEDRWENFEFKSINRTCGVVEAPHIVYHRR